MNEERSIQIDRMRFTKNTASSRMAIFAIVFNVFYFVSIYKSDVENYYYTLLIGVSIVYNLVFMLVTFLCSEGVKNYKRKFSWALVALGVIQIARIFIIPAQMHGIIIQSGIETSINILNYHIPATMDETVMGTLQYVHVVAYLLLSALCLFRSALINLKKSRALADHIANLDSCA